MVSSASPSNKEKPGTILVDIVTDKTTPGGSTGKKTENIIRGVLPFVHLGDHASLCDENLAARLTQGTSLERLVVVEVNRLGVPVVSLKPLLLLSATSAEKRRMDIDEGDGDENKTNKVEAFIPRGASELSPGDLVAGFVSKVETFGVFVRFLGRFTALAPKAMVADRLVENPTGMFEEGDSVR